MAASDLSDQRTALGPFNSSCIDLYAPGGGLGVGATGASPAGPANYTTVINRAFNAAAVVAGVAAQVLELSPNASAAEVLAALQGGATPHAVTGAGTAARALLAFTDAQEPKPEGGGGTNGGGGSGNGGGSSDGSSGSGGGMSTGAVVGIAVAATVGE